MKLKKLINRIDREGYIKEVNEIEKRKKQLKSWYNTDELYILNEYISNTCSLYYVFEMFGEIQDFRIENDIENFNIIKL